MAIIEHVCTDMGNGASYCSECGERLSENPLAPLPKSCPQCKAEFMGSAVYPYAYGGSDF